MKHRKKYFFFSLVSICFFSLSCFFVSLSSHYQIDSFCNKLVSYTNYSLKNDYAFPLVSISSKSDEFDYKKVFSNVYYNSYVQYYRCNADTLIYYPDDSKGIKTTIISQPTFWSTPYVINDTTTIHRLDHSAYFLKYPSDYSSHGNDAFFFLSQSLANYLCETYKITEEDLLNKTYNFINKNGEVKKAYVSNIVVDGYGYADYQTKEKGFFVLSYLLFDPIRNTEYKARFDIRMKLNPRGNSNILNSCLSSCALSDYSYDFYTFSKTENGLVKNTQMNNKFQQINRKNDAIVIISLAIILSIYISLDALRFYYFKKRQDFVLLTSLISLVLFIILGLLSCFVYVFYIFGAFTLLFFGVDALFLIFYILLHGFKKTFKKMEGNGFEKNLNFISLKV